MIQTQFNEMKKEIITTEEKRYKDAEAKTETEEGLNQYLLWERKTYKTNARTKLLKLLKNNYDKRIQEQLNKLQEVENAKEFNGEFIITIEWAKSHTWGSNPRASTNYGFNGTGISGCGYDKLSTATAQALNSDNRILKLLYIAKEKAIKKAKRMLNPDKTKMSTSDINRKFLGYGAGYNILPSFEGGVGVSSHEHILENLGLKMRSISDTKTTNVYLIRRDEE